MKVKYNVGDAVRAKINYQNDRRREVEAVIISIEVQHNEDIMYKIRFEPEESDKKRGCTECEGYVGQQGIIQLLSA